MKISLITVTFNSSKTISTTLESVANQSYKHIEHIIIDGNSTDNTLLIAKQYNHISIITSEKDDGIYDAMNKGIEKASGEIIGFLNSDDWFSSSTYMEEIASQFKTTDIDAIYSDLDFVKNEEDNKSFRRWVAGEYKENSFLDGWVPPHPTFYAKLDVYKKYGLFDSSLKFAADFDIMCRFIAKEKIKIKYLPGVKVKMRLGGATTKNLINIILGNIEIYKSLKRNNLPVGVLFFLRKIYTKLKQFK